MKSLIIISMLVIFTTGSALCQSRDTTMEKKQEQKQVGQDKTDKFIDRDGDGISDRREEGLGFKRGKHKEEKQRGKNQGVLGKKGPAGIGQPTGSGAGKPDRGGK